MSPSIAGTARRDLTRFQLEAQERGVEEFMLAVAASIGSVPRPATAGAPL
jgi:hypothetical protein